MHIHTHIKRSIIIVFSLFWKMNVGLCNLHAVCLCSPLSTFVWLNQSSWNLVCISKHLSPSQSLQSVCVYKRILLSLLGNGSVKTLSRQWIHVHQNCWTRRFLWGRCRIKQSRRLVLPRNFCSKKKTTRVESGSNTSAVTLRVVGGDEKGSLRYETVTYGRKYQGTRTRERLRWQEPATHIKERPVLSSERASHKYKTVTVKQ
jgi:hypothetical protein